MWPGPCCCDESSSTYIPTCDDVCDPMPRKWDVSFPFDPASVNPCVSNFVGTYQVVWNGVESGSVCQFNTRERLIFPRCNFPPNYSPCTLETYSLTFPEHTFRLVVSRSGANRIYRLRCYFWNTDPLESFTILIDESVTVLHSADCEDQITKAITAGSLSCDFSQLTGTMTITPVL